MRVGIPLSSCVSQSWQPWPYCKTYRNKLDLKTARQVLAVRSHCSDYGQKDDLINGIRSAQNRGPGVPFCGYIHIHYASWYKLPVVGFLFSPSFTLKTSSWKLS